MAPAPVSPAATPAPAAPTAAATAPATATAPAAATGQPAPAAPPPSTQIWECTTNGQKIFANRSCGANAVLREVGPVNGMDPAPRFAPNRRFYPQPNESPDYSDPDSSEYPSDYPPEYSDGAYPVLVGIPLKERRRPAHTHQPPKHVGAPPARRY
jgi:hypothetical protein